MAIEKVRGCGYRRVGGMYLCGGYLSVTCDRMPYELRACPVCGAGIHFTRSMTEINPLELFGQHDGQGVILEGDVGGILHCQDDFRPCMMCDPTEDTAYIMMVGKKYYSPTSFTKEATEMGISKRIAHIPKNLVLGKTIVYLAHPQAVTSLTTQVNNNGQGKMMDEKLGIFCAFIPHKVEKLIWQSEATDEELARLRKHGITPVVIPNGEADHI